MSYVHVIDDVYAIYRFYNAPPLPPLHLFPVWREVGHSWRVSGLAGFYCTEFRFQKHKQFRMQYYYLLEFEVKKIKIVNRQVFSL